jgi:hypothetical protein
MAATKPVNSQKTDEERNLDKLRCQTCGKFHPFISVCPYIKSVRVEQIRDSRNPTLRGRITTTEYFERAELLSTAVESLEEAQEILNENDSVDK